VYVGRELAGIGAYIDHGLDTVPLRPDESISIAGSSPFDLNANQPQVGADCAFRPLCE